MISACLAQDVQQDNIAVFSICPGWVATDMTKDNPDPDGLKCTPHDSVNDVVKNVIAAFKSDNNRKFFNKNGEIVPW